MAVSGCSSWRQRLNLANDNLANDCVLLSCAQPNLQNRHPPGLSYFGSASSYLAVPHARGQLYSRAAEYRRRGDETRSPRTPAVYSHHGFRCCCPGRVRGALRRPGGPPEAGFRPQGGGAGRCEGAGRWGSASCMHCTSATKRTPAHVWSVCPCAEGCGDRHRTCGGAPAGREP